jgi:hypothetical protein
MLSGCVSFDRCLFLPGTIEGRRTSSTSWMGWKTDSKWLRRRSTELPVTLMFVSYRPTWRFRKEYLSVDFRSDRPVRSIRIYEEQNVNQCGYSEQLTWLHQEFLMASVCEVICCVYWSHDMPWLKMIGSIVQTYLRRRTAERLWRDWSGLSCSSQVVVSWAVFSAMNWLTSGELLLQLIKRTNNTQQIDLLGAFILTEHTLIPL